MKIGVIVDGQAEFHALPLLWPRVSTPHTLISPIYADLQPLSPVTQIAKSVRLKLAILQSRHVDRVVVLIDREGTVCPGHWAREIESLLQQDAQQRGIGSVYVVSKVACLENWLIADTSVFQHMPKRFRTNVGRFNDIPNDRADYVNAQVLLQRMAVGDKYSKIEDAMRILQRANPSQIGRNSRSFRRFLRVVENPLYLAQSVAPANVP